MTLLVLSTLAAVAAAAAPWYVTASTEKVAIRHVESAPIEERSMEAIAVGPIEGGSLTAQLESTARLTESIVGLSGFTVYTQAFVTGQANAGQTGQPVAAGQPAAVPRATTSPLVVRTDACAHASIEGRCATAADEIMLSYRTARWLRLQPGATLGYSSAALDAPVVFKVVGIYRPDDPADPFWSSNGEVLARDLPTSASPEITEPVDDAVLAGPAVFEKLQPKKLSMIVDLVAEPALLVDHSPAEVRDTLNAATVVAADNRLTLNTRIGAVIDRVEHDRTLVSVGVPVGAFQLLVLCWFALYLAVKYTGEERRPDVGLVKLRGATRARTWALVSGQSALPMLGGALLGLPIGYLLATAVTGRIRDSAANVQAAELSVVAVAVAVLGALLAAMFAERRALGSTVAELLRQSPARARGWRDLFDLVLVVIAVIAVVQVKQRAAGDAAGLALIAPGLAALAFALVAARIVTLSASRLVEGALRHGRPARALTAIYLARRPGVHRLTALMIVTVALLCTSFLTWHAGREAGRARAELEVGADRVLVVRAENRLALLNAVRAADPSGKYAMAAVESLRSGKDRVLLVDSPRLAAVATWRPEYGMTAEQTAAALHPPAPAPVYLTGDEVALDIDVHFTAADPERVVFFDAVFADPAGGRLTARTGPLKEGPQRLRVPTPACTTAPGCRFSSLALMQSTLEQKVFFSARPGVEVTVHALAQAGPNKPLLTKEQLADRVAWRLTVTDKPPNLIVSPVAAGLLLRIAPVSSGATDPGVYRIDSPAPIASVRAKVLQSRVIGDQRVSYGATTLSERIAATAGRLPRLGDQGVLVDLEYADRLGADFGAGESLQVWLARGAPKDIVGRLGQSGVILLSEESIDGTAEHYASFGPPLTLQFMFLSAVIGLALAIGSASVVAAVERRPRSRELNALRTQGASSRLVRRVSIEGYLVMVGTSLVLGLAVAFLIRLYIGDVLPYFADGWSAP